MSNSRPLEITAGPDGNVWFTDSDGTAIGRITPEDQITEFSQGMSTWTTTSPPGPNGPFAIVAGPDGNLWFTEPARMLIGRITPSGAITEFSAGISPGSNPMWITAGPDGNIWFTAAGRGLLARITPDGQITEIEATGGPSAGAITAGPDGNLWFTDGLARLGRVTPAGEVAAFSGVLDPFDSAAGPDGNLWFRARPRPDRTHHHRCDHHQVPRRHQQQSALHCPGARRQPLVQRALQRRDRSEHPGR